MIGIKIEIHFSCQLDGVFVLHQRKIFGFAQTNFKNGETLAKVSHYANKRLKDSKMTLETTVTVQKCLKLLKAAFLERRHKIAYVGGWLGHDNLGDEALFEAFKHLFSDFNFIHFDGGRLAISFATHTKLFKAGLLGGGTLISQSASYFKIAKSFMGCNHRFFVFGSGVATPLFWPNEPTLEQWKPLLERCGFIGVRGPISAQRLMDIGLANTEVVGDPVISFALQHINLSPIPKTLGINIGTADGRLWGSEDYVLAEVSKLAKIARQSGWTIKWFVVWPKDMEITRKAALLTNTAAEIYTIFNDHRKFIELVRPLTAFVGMKLHATILATCALTPSVMLEYRPKCRDFMKSIDQEDLTFRTDKFKAKDIWEIVSFWDLHHQEAAMALLDRLVPLKEKQRMLAHRLSYEIINSEG